MGIRERWRRLQSDRAARRAQRLYSDGTESWLAQLRELQHRHSLLTGSGVQSADVPIQLSRGEACLGSWIGFNLIEPRSVRVTNYYGVSHRVSAKTTVRTGQARSTNQPDELRPIDSGTFVVTDRRVVFIGRTRTIAWEFRKLMTISRGDPRLFVFHVSNRQRAQGIQYYRGAEHGLQLALEAAMARFDGSAPRLAASVATAWREIVRTAPAPPHGVAVDERVLVITGSTKSEPRVLLEPEESWTRVGLVETSLDTLTAALTLAKVMAPVVMQTEQPTPDWDALDRAAEAGVADSLWFAGNPMVVVIGDQEWLADQFDLAAAHLLVLASQAVLAEFGLGAADVGVELPQRQGFANTSYDEVLQAAVKVTHLLVPVDATAIGGLSKPLLEAVSAVAQIHEAIWPERVSVAVVHAGGQDLALACEGLLGFDSVMLCGPSAELEELGIPLLDSEERVEIERKGSEDDVAAAAPSQLSEGLTMMVAGRTVERPVEVVLEYLRDHGGTVNNCDFLAGSFETVTADVVRATRWMSSRISNEQEGWLIERAKTAAWGTVELEASLATADPGVDGGLYDRASALYNHFRDDAPRGVGPAKVSKVLYMLRPNLVPLLDSRLRKTYDRAARDAARRLSDSRDALKGSKWLYWAAIREDLRINAASLQRLRTALAATNWDFAREAAAGLTDLRLLDVCTWSRDGDAGLSEMGSFTIDGEPLHKNPPPGFG